MTAGEFDPGDGRAGAARRHGCSIGRGWTTSRKDLLAAHDQTTDVIYLVAGDRDVLGQTGVIMLIHLDRRFVEPAS